MFGNIFTSAQRFIEDAKKKVKQFISPKPAPIQLPKISQESINRATSGGSSNLPKPSFTQPTPAPSARLIPKPMVSTPKPNYTSAETRQPAYAPPPTPEPMSLINTAQRYISPALDKLKSSIGPLEKGHPFELGLQGIGRLAQKFPDTTIRLPDKAYGLFETPQGKVSKMVNEFITSMPGEIVRSTGQAAELFGSEKGRGKIAKGVTEVPGQIKKIATSGQRTEGVGELFSNPATIALLGLTNVIPGGGVVPKLGKKAVEKAVLEQGAKKLTEKEAIALAKKEAEKVAKGVKVDINKLPKEVKVVPKESQVTLFGKSEAVPKTDIVGASAEATPETLAKAEAKKIAEETKTAVQAEKQALKESGVPITANQQATKVAQELKKATEAGTEVPVGKPYEGSKLKGIYQRLLLPAEKVVSDQGVAGKRLAELLDITHREGSITAGKAVVEMEQAIKKLSDEEMVRFMDVAEGKIPADTPALQKALDVWDTIRTDIANKSEQLGLEIKLADGKTIPFTPRENFAPHFIPEDIVNNAKARKDAFVRMVNEGQALSVAEAEQKFNQFAYSRSARRYGHLEKAREANFPIYEKDPRKVFLNYIDGSYRRLSDAKHLGTNDELAYELANRVGVEGGDMQLVTQVLNRILGKENIDTFGQDVARNLMGFQTITKLDVGSAVVNLGQSISTALRTNVITTAKAIGDALGKNRAESRMFAQQTGEILESSIRDFERLAGGDNNLIGKYIRLIQFSRTETFNRIVAANAGKRYAEELTAKLLKNPQDIAVIRELERLKLNPKAILENGGLLEDDALRAGYQVSEDTQFRVDKQTLPLWWSSPSGRVLSQYKTFTYKQTVFLAETVKRVAQETRKGNIKPLANFLVTVGVVAPVAGEIINNIKSLIRGQQRDETGLERYINDVFSTFSLGLLSDVGTLVTGKYGTKGTAGVFAGPTGSDVLGGIEAIQSLFNDRSSLSGMDEVAARTKPLLRFGISKIPFIGRPAVSNIDFLKSETQVGKETKRKVEQTYNQLKTMQEQGASAEEQTDFWNSLDNKTQNSITDMAEDKKFEATDEEVKTRDLNVKNRAETVYNQLKTMQEQGASAEEQEKYWSRLYEIGIMTDSVEKEIYRLKEERAKPQSNTGENVFQQVAEAVVPSAYAAEKIGYTNSPTFTSGNANWNSFIESAKRIADQEGFPLAVILGQAALETGRRSGPGNNYFGIKGYGNAGSNSLATKEQGATGLFSTTGNFAAYQTPEDSIKAYINLIKTRYPSAYALKDNPQAMITEIKRLGYATDNNYVAKVMGTPEFRAYQNYKPAPKTAAVPKKAVPAPAQSQGLFSNFMSSIFGG